ncbi:tetraspanin-8-like [Solea solea]|uniref:tetraspanin-8-like n=1 Tax=Solea solea TaxID=90069 RepID=UPI00272A9A14|nr:tetraspanin-8-like [Solea solea]
MILMSLILFPSAVFVLAGKSQLIEEFGNQYRDVGPLSESREFQQNLLEQQKKFQCCGLAQGYMDWGHDIPDTCECTGSATSNPCVELNTKSNSVRMVYEKPCLPYLMEDYEWFVTVFGGIAMAFVLLWMLSVVLSIVILCKLCQKEDAPAVVYHTGEN